MTDKKWFSKALLATAIGISVSSTALIAQPTGGERPADRERPDTSKPVVTVTERGSNAKALRYRFSPGSETEFRIVNSMSIEGQQGQADPMSQTLPTISQGVTLTISSVEEDGTAKVSAVIKTVGVDAAPGSQPGMDGMLRQQLAPLVGTEATYTVSNRGEVSDLTLANPAILQSQLGQFAEQFMQNIESAVILLPEEAVGSNGKWTVATDMEMFAIKAKQTADFSVTNMSDDRATIDYRMRINAGEQKIDDPNLQPGMEASLEGLDGSFNGQYTVDLTSPIAKGTVTSTMTIRTKVNQMGQEMRMRQTVNSTVAVTDPEDNSSDSE